VVIRHYNVSVIKKAPELNAYLGVYYIGTKMVSTQVHVKRADTYRKFTFVISFVFS